MMCDVRLQLADLVSCNCFVTTNEMCWGNRSVREAEQQRVVLGAAFDSQSTRASHASGVLCFAIQTQWQQRCKTEMVRWLKTCRLSQCQLDLCLDLFGQ